MKDNLPSLTAATVGFISSLRWYKDHGRSVQTSNLMRNMSQRHMPLPLWLFMRITLSHAIITSFIMTMIDIFFGKSKGMEGVFMRKDFMEHQVKTFIQDNKDKEQLQVVILAAGYDVLALNMARKYPNISFVKVDHPATGEAKLAALRSMEKKGLIESLPHNLHFCHDAIGESCTIKDAIEKNGIKHISTKKNIPTAIIMEGLSFYLTKEENKKVFKELDECFGCKGSIVAFDFFHLDEYGRPTNANVSTSKSEFISSLMKYKVRLMGEPFKFGISPDNLEDFFSDTRSWYLRKLRLRVMAQIIRCMQQ